MQALGASPEDVLSGLELTRFKAEISTIAAKVGVEISRLTSEVGMSPPWLQNQRDKLRSLQDQQRTVEAWMNTVGEVVRSGTIEGQPVKRRQAAALSEMGGKLVNNYAQTVQSIAYYSPTAILTRSVMDISEKLSDLGNKLFELARAIIEALLGAGRGAADTLALLKYLPFILVGVLVLPALFRTGAAYKRGGSAAALDEAAGQIERGRSRAYSGAKRAFKFAGSPRRRRRFSR